MLIGRDLPLFPDALQGRLTAQRMADEARREEGGFFDNFERQCRQHSIPYSGPSSEDRVQLRRLLARHSVEELNGAIADFLQEHGGTFDKGYHHHMRLFAAWMKR